MSAGLPTTPSVPTREGVRRWPPDGYLRLNGAVDVRQQVACTCAERCGECHGDCGCEACELGWLVYQDEQALWDEQGNLLNVIELGAAWKRVSDPRQLHLRFHGIALDPSAAAGEDRSVEDAGAWAPDDPSSVPPIYQDGSDPAEGSATPAAPRR
jgi:hypothetical protein